MKRDFLAFSQYCKENLNTEIKTFRPSARYKSLPICIVDCVYSLRAKYFLMTVPVVKRYADNYLGGNIYSSDDTLSAFISHIKAYESSPIFARDILKNNQVLSGRNKTEVCLEVATKMYELLDINTLEDFQQFKKEELLDLVLRSVKGMGDAGINYLFMLAGDPNRCKPDVHIHRCINDAIGHGVSNGECQILFSETVKILNEIYPWLTVRDLDNIIWRKYQSKK